MAVIKAVSSKAGIGQALDYVTKEEKTEDKLVSGLHCEPDTVKDEMQATKELWGKTGTSNVYVANKDLVWNSWGNNIDYCEFPANIVLSRSEQEERTKIYDKRVTTVQTQKD